VVSFGFLKIIRQDHTALNSQNGAQMVNEVAAFAVLLHAKPVQQKAVLVLAVARIFYARVVYAQAAPMYPV